MCILELRLNHKIIFQNFTSNETPSHPHTYICILLYFSGEDSSWIIISSHLIISKFKNSQASSHLRKFCVISKRSCPVLKIWFQPICLHSLLLHFQEETILITPRLVHFPSSHLCSLVPLSLVNYGTKRVKKHFQMGPNSTPDTKSVLHTLRLELFFLPLKIKICEILLLKRITPLTLRKLSHMKQISSFLQERK